MESKLINDKDHEIKCYNYLKSNDVIVGNVKRFDSDDEDGYWHFYPSPDAMICAGDLMALANFIAELNVRR